MDPAIRDKARAWNKKTYGTHNPTADAKAAGISKAELAKQHKAKGSNAALAAKKKKAGDYKGNPDLQPKRREDYMHQSDGRPSSGGVSGHADRVAEQPKHKKAAADAEKAVITKHRMQASLKAPLPAKPKPAPASISSGAKKAELAAPASAPKPESRKTVRKGNRADRKDARVAKRKGKKATAAPMTPAQRTKLEGSIRAAQRLK